MLLPCDVTLRNDALNIDLEGGVIDVVSLHSVTPSGDCIINLARGKGKNIP